MMLSHPSNLFQLSQLQLLLSAPGQERSSLLFVNEGLQFETRSGHSLLEGLSARPDGTAEMSMVSCVVIGLILEERLR